MDILYKETYLAMVQNAVGSKLFQTVFVSENGEKKDILNKGDLSCAFFVSSILHHFKLIGAPHVTVSSTVRDLKKTGWKETDEYREGVVLVWEEKEQKGERHKHIGFYIGNDQAVSNNPQGDTPYVHHVTFDGARKVEAVYTHEFLS